LPFPVESGCKDTTFFQTCKFFFAFSRIGRPKEMSDSGLRQKKIFNTDGLRQKNTPKKTKNHTDFSQNSGSYHLEKVKIRIFI